MNKKLPQTSNLVDRDTHCCNETKITLYYLAKGCYASENLFRKVRSGFCLKFSI